CGRRCSAAGCTSAAKESRSRPWPPSIWPYGTSKASTSASRFIACSAGGSPETRDLARRWVGQGYTAVKFGWEPMGQSEQLDIELVAGAREGLGDATLLVDAGCVWDARTALRRAHAFAEYRPEWLEEPLREDDIDGYV